MRIFTDWHDAMLFNKSPVFLLCHIVESNIVSRGINDILAYHTIPYHTVSYHTIPYHPGIRLPGHVWMVYGPRSFVPSKSVEVIQRRFVSLTYTHAHSHSLTHWPSTQPGDPAESERRRLHAGSAHGRGAHCHGPHCESQEFTRV